MPPSISHGDVSGGTNFCMCLHQHPLCMRAAKTLASLRICAGSPEPSLLDNESHELAQRYHIDVDSRDRGVVGSSLTGVTTFCP